MQKTLDCSQIHISSFPIATVTNYLRLCSWNSRSVFSPGLGGRHLRSQSWQTHVLSEALEKEPCLSPHFDGCQESSADSPLTPFSDTSLPPGGFHSHTLRFYMEARPRECKRVAGRTSILMVQAYDFALSQHVGEKTLSTSAVSASLPTWVPQTPAFPVNERAG